MDIRSPIDAPSMTADPSTMEGASMTADPSTMARPSTMDTAEPWQPAEVTVVVATHNRARQLRHCLTALIGLPERPEIIVVDNGSDDTTADLVRVRFPEAQLISLPRNAGAVARNIGV